MFRSLPAGRQVSYRIRVIAAGIGLLFVVGLNGCGTAAPEESSKQEGAAGPAPPVVVAEVRRQEVPLEIRAIGNIEAFSRVQVKSQVAGQIERVHFQEGDDVRQGQILFQIDPRQFRQAVREAEAALANAKAALAQSEANYERDLAEAKNARSQANRYAELASKGIIPRIQNEQYETSAIAAEKGAAASKVAIESARAAVEGAEAKLSDARLQLSYTTIRAPISGRTGNLTQKAGNLVAVNADTPLVIINQITPAYATFSIPEQSLSELRRYADRGKLLVEALPSQAQGPPAQGQVDFLDNEVDQSTGTILMKARFPNTDRRLWPGQFVNVVVRLTRETANLVPTAAVRTSQTGNYVFVVKSDSTAEQRTVDAARTWNDFTVVGKGVEPGERVIVEGQVRVRSGTKVQVVRTWEPTREQARNTGVARP
ncbi:MAG: efflux RND transporter periplasmic adaptor subunit [Bryobacteraceae bacterium]|nr:efflux RND transporter periplasmic adaptor subunit [Bryobacteraceae bacterium]